MRGVIEAALCLFPSVLSLSLSLFSILSLSPFFPTLECAVIAPIIKQTNQKHMAGAVPGNSVSRSKALKNFHRRAPSVWDSMKYYLYVSLEYVFVLFCFENHRFPFTVLILLINILWINQKLNDDFIPLHNSLSLRFYDICLEIHRDRNHFFLPYIHWWMH